MNVSTFGGSMIVALAAYLVYNEVSMMPTETADTKDADAAGSEHF